MLECDVCKAHVSELRRGRCWGCYQHYAEGRPVGLGARCSTCGEKRRRLLKSVELLGGWRPCCFNCAGQIALLEPVPRTLLGIRDAMNRDRRKRDRRIGKADTRVFQYERRVGERRTERGIYSAIDDDMIIEISVEPPESGSVEVDFDDITAIRELIQQLRPEELAAG